MFEIQDGIWPSSLATTFLILALTQSLSCVEAEEAVQCKEYPRTEEGYTIDLGPAMKGYNPFEANQFAEDGLDPGLKTGVIFDSSCGQNTKEYPGGVGCTRSV